MSAQEVKRVVLAIDGGNVKTDVALVNADGHLLSLIRGGTSSPHVIGFEACVELLADLVADARLAAGLGRETSGAVTGQRAGNSESALEPFADVARVLLAGADFDEEVEALQQALATLGWASQLVVENDTLALLRTGTDRGWGVAVVCGGGINAVGIAPDGREERFLALQGLIGDWGGGQDVGVAALGAAVRSADRRGPVSTLERAVPQHFGMESAREVARAVHYKEISLEALAQLSPLVYEQSAVDPAARSILERLAYEVSAFATAALKRLGPDAAGADVVLGGGLMRPAPEWMIERIREQVHAVSVSATVVVAHEGPIVGATMLGLDAIGAGPDAIARARVELQDAIEELGQQPVA
jgi:N-acetylglucosamine kinase-like BadF-type ATPase